MYTTEANIAARLGTSLTDDQASYFNDVLSDSIDAYINRVTGTAFSSTDSVDVYVDGTDSNMLIIPTMHDITSVSVVENDGTETAIPVDEYRTYPQGETDKYAIRNLNGTWTEGIENYKVTGSVGFTDVPADLVEVATEMAVNSLNANVNNYQSEKVGDWSVTYSGAQNSLSSDSVSTLNSYRRLSRSI
jgi:hypothetical protein